MPTWNICAARNAVTTVAAGQTSYITPMGWMMRNNVEANQQLICRDNYTLANGLIRVTANTRTQAATLVSRVNGANGNITITIGAGLTGEFQDAVNNDALAAGDLFCYFISCVGGVGNLDFTIVGGTLYCANDNPIISGADYANIAAGNTGYLYMGGYPVYEAFEVRTPMLTRTPTTLANMSITITANGVLAATTLRCRINGVNGNQLITIGAGLTGRFEDAINTDAMIAGDTVNGMMVVGAGGTNIQPTVFAFRSNCTVRHTISSLATSLANGLTRYISIESGVWQLAALEADVQYMIRAAVTAQNYFVRVYFNSLDGATTIRSRVNGANGNLLITVGAGLTGAFEDLVNNDALIATDEYDSQIVTGGTGGVIYICYVVFEQAQRAGGGMPAGNMIDKMIAGKLV